MKRKLDRHIIKNGKKFIICRICNEIKLIDAFPKHKECTWNKDTRYKDCRSKYLKKYHEEHKEEISKKIKDYIKKYNNSEIAKERKRNYKKKTRVRIIENLRNRLWYMIKGMHKSQHTLELLGCSVEKLKQHLQSQFKEGMTWDNYGRGGWEIDHIYPISKIDLNNEQEIKRVCHYTNLQPLWGFENASKGNKILSDTN